MGFEVLAVVDINITVLLLVTLCSLVERVRGAEIPGARSLWQQNFVW
jgi:hypothetical protein